MFSYRFVLFVHWICFFTFFCVFCLFIFVSLFVCLFVSFFLSFFLCLFVFYFSINSYYFLQQAGYTSKISRDDSVGGPARGASGTFSASNPPPSSSDSFSSSSSGEGDMVGYDVTVKNVVTSKNKFKVVTKDRVFNLKAINDDKVLFSS